MRKLISVLCSCCLCWMAALVIGATPASAGRKVCVCHIPPGNPGNAHTICVGAPAVRAHLGHGDTLGACPVVCGGLAGDTCGDDQFCKHDEGVCAEGAEGVCTDIPASCPTPIDPVCGCDGTTYDNACLADAAGVTVQHPGACEGPTACGGSAGDTCEDDQFCKREDGVCAAEAEGVCAEIPVFCPAVPDPVCGCDGTTYSNACYADVAGIPVQHDGACEEGQACGGSEGEGCEEGAFCRPARGECSEGAAGTCVQIPPVCPRVLSPVCGCDGTTYGNACLADTAGVGVDHAGACEADQQACGGSEGAACGEGEFCKRPEGECAQEAEGICEDTPEKCPAILEPACGCDGTTYSNACIADAAGVTVANEGQCEPERACGGLTQPACPEGEFCKRAEGACAADAEGGCAEVPVQCPLVIDEVCGCDGTTYQNECFADAAGVAVQHSGACAPPE